MGTLQYSVRVRNAMLNAIRTTIGTGATLNIRTGAQPANCAASSTGTILAAIALPTPYLADASGGSQAMTGVWADNAANAGGTAAHYEIIAADSVCDERGDITITGGGGKMELDGVVFAAGQQFTITSFSTTAGNA